MGKKTKKRKGNSETEARAREEMNNGRRMDFTRENSVGSVYLAKATLTTKTHTNARFD